MSNARLRAVTMCQTMSLSRFDEISKWEIADLADFIYDQTSSACGSHPIEILSVAQHFHKAAAVSRSNITFELTLMIAM